MNPRLKKFFSYYKPYLGLFYSDMACAIVVSITVLGIPLCIRYITKNLETQSPDALDLSIGKSFLSNTISINLFCFLEMKRTKAPNDFGRKVRQRRHDLGYSQEKLAELADLHHNYVGSVESGERNIALENSLPW